MKHQYHSIITMLWTWFQCTVRIHVSELSETKLVKDNLALIRPIISLRMLWSRFPDLRYILFISHVSTTELPPAHLHLYEILFMATFFQVILRHHYFALPSWYVLPNNTVVDRSMVKIKLIEILIFWGGRIRMPLLRIWAITPSSVYKWLWGLLDCIETQRLNESGALLMQLQSGHYSWWNENLQWYTFWASPTIL